MAGRLAVEWIETSDGPVEGLDVEPGSRAELVVAALRQEYRSRSRRWVVRPDKAIVVAKQPA